MIKKIVRWEHRDVEMEFESEQHYQHWLKTHSDDQSHSKFFKNKKKIATVAEDGTVNFQKQMEAVTYKEDERDARQRMRRSKKIEQELVNTVLNRAPAGPTTQVETVSFEKYRDLQADYMQAIQEGESPASALRRVGFQPLAAYQSKLWPPGKKPIRPMIQHEVGIRPNGKIVCLEMKVPGDIGEVVVGPHTKHNQG